MKQLKVKLEKLYNQYNRRKYVHPDPLEFLYKYDNLDDREIVALIASSLAYGRVAQILKSVTLVLEKMQPGPNEFLQKNSYKKITKIYKGFRHRFSDQKELSALLYGIKQIKKKYGSLHTCFIKNLNKNDKNLLPALTLFVEELTTIAGESPGHLIPLPEKGSACKRLFLFLRWMVRNDSVDPGGWSEASPDKLIIPLDTHMYNIGYTLGFTKRKQANMLAAKEITDSFKKINAKDPVKYDFALTRLGIRDDTDMDSFLKGCHL